MSSNSESSIDEEELRRYDAMNKKIEGVDPLWPDKILARISFHVMEDMPRFYSGPMVCTWWWVQWKPPYDQMDGDDHWQEISTFMIGHEESYLKLWSNFEDRFPWSAEFVDLRPPGLYKRFPFERWEFIEKESPDDAAVKRLSRDFLMEL